MEQSTLQSLLPIIGAAVGAIAALTGVFVNAWLTRRRERNAVLRSAIADFITASVIVVNMFDASRRYGAEIDVDQYHKLNDDTTRTEQALWLTFTDQRLVPAAREVTEATAAVIETRDYSHSGSDFFAALRRAREAHVSLFIAARDLLGGNESAGLPPHLSSPLDDD